MKVILFEDEFLIRENVVDVLSARGDSVLVLVGAQDISEDHFIGITDEGADLLVKLADYDIAIVDGTLLGAYHGWELIPTLLAHNVVCIAHSSDFANNAKMLEVGAQESANKSRHSDLQALIRHIETKASIMRDDCTRRL